ncbi:hypothetical protein VP01_5104g2 [Puccinia sorghi]|uniref:Uncharacterized protein n=1 Tax=Puccinia sorghi TaxID=27349 RepID=A0A0L6ULZ4_9BASI|nr:hypothetical protein VP01_5104g2 [Puccinia sorghi]
MTKKKYSKKPTNNFFQSVRYLFFSVIQTLHSHMCFLEQSSTESLELVHKNNTRYVSNSAALSSHIRHWKAVHLQFLFPGPLCWINVMHDGLTKWCETIKKKVKK